MSGLGHNEMTIRVLEDGTLRIETGDMGGVAHKQADDFLKEVQRLMGGQVEVTKSKDAHHHHHGHDQAHDHAHDHDHLKGGH